MLAPNGIVSLTTDFGLLDTYVGQLHAVLLRENPMVKIVDLSHNVDSQTLDSALFHTQAAWGSFSSGTVHLVVVDPGVGSDRGIILIEVTGKKDSPPAFLIGPDTGILSSGLPDEMRLQAPNPSGPVSTTTGVSAVEITSATMQSQQISRTFHGRDIMAPVAAYVAAGHKLDKLGIPIDSVIVSPVLEAGLDSKGCGTGRIIHIDQYGNAITNIRLTETLPTFRLQVRDTEINGPALSYKDGSANQQGKLLVIEGSSGFLEIAAFKENAAKLLDLSTKDPVSIFSN